MSNENPLKSKPKALNPYRHGKSLIKNRLRWDMKRESWSSRRTLRYYRDQFEGEKAVILCNGPSLLDVDFDLLESSGVHTFGLNKINLLFDKVSFRPSFIVAVNSLVIEQNREFYNQTKIPLFLDTKAIKIGVGSRDNIAYLHSTSIKGEFARDCTWSIFQGHTVTYVAMQLAYHMGFQEVALVGCDHNFATKGPANKEVVSGEHDPNHFDPNYFANGAKWHLPDLFESEVAYKLAGDMYELTGRSLYNATTGGKLDIFPRISLSKFLEK